MVTRIRRKAGMVGAGWRSPAEVERLAGRAAGARSRRGSVLVLIVGALALLSVITVVYVTIGRGDRRTAANVVRNQALDLRVGSIADYMARVIGDDSLATFSDPAASTAFGVPTSFREGWDAPTTDPALRSDIASPTDRRHFDPVGAGCDPWLAATEPTYLGTTPPASSDPLDAYLDLRDWAQISNFAPDGRFVNLFFLRGNFDAEPGTGTDADGKGRLSSYLSLLAADGQTATTTLDVGGGADLDIPAHWSTRQRGAARPLSDPLYDWSDRRNFAYQWADADGDGLADSRWFELVDASSFDFDGRITEVLPRDGRFRYFVAARAIDLSALVNVNTATDFVRAPDDDFPPGMSPADVDLRRLLTMIDAYDSYGLGYESIEQPATGGGYEDYSDYDVDAGWAVGHRGYRALRDAVFNIEEFGKTWDPGRTNFLQDAGTRAFTYFTVGGLANAASFTGSGALAVGNLMGRAEQIELMTYRAINSSQTQSRLEQAVGGQMRTRDFFGFSPLRDNRPTDLERGGLTDDAPSGTDLVDADGRLLLAVDVRSRLTAMSGARPLVSAINPSPDALDEGADLAIDVVAAAAAAPVLFNGYADGLLPLSSERGTWDKAGHPEMLTLHYGHDPELAIRLAAHQAVNLADSRDEDDLPSRATVLIDGDFARLDAASAGPFYDGYSLSDDPATPPSLLELRNREYPWWWGGQRLRLPSSRLARGIDRSEEVTEAPALNVYGVEAQPFIAEVVTYFMYTDTPYRDPSTGLLLGGDQEWREVDTDGDGVPDRILYGPVTIDGQFDPPTMLGGNPDALLQIVAFQLTNPFDTTVTLSNAFTPLPREESSYNGGTPSDPTDDNLPDGLVVSHNQGEFYYIEFGGRYYMCASLVDEKDDTDGDGALEFDGRLTLHGITIGPRETIVLYALADDKRDIAELRWAPQDTTNPDTATNDAARLEGWLDAQFSGANIAGIYRIPRIAWEKVALHTAGGVEDPGSRADELDAAVFDRGFAPVISSTAGANDQVRLWRALKANLTSDRGEFPWETGFRNERANDLLADRLRDPASNTLDRSLPPSNQEVAGTQAGPEDDPTNIRDNTGFTITVAASLRRPSSPVGAPDVGVIPAYCLEVKSGFLGTNMNKQDATSPNPSALTRGDFSGSDGDTTFNAMWSSPESVWASIKDDPGTKTGHFVPANRNGLSFADVCAEFFLNNENFESVNGENLLRVGDAIQVLAVGPVQDPRQTDREQEWLTVGEALAVALNYSSPAPGRVMADVGDATTGALRRGTLILDRFVPFYDLDGPDRVYTPDTADVRRFPGIPLAMHVLNQFTGLDATVGSLTRATPGRVNIATAPLAVLRVLPMLSPANASADAPAPEWWWTGSAHTLDSDIASAILAYREKTALTPRFDTSGAVLNFLDSDPGAAFDPSLADARTLATGIVAIREDRGIQSVGELLAVRDRNFPVPRRHDMDRFGTDLAAMSAGDAFSKLVDPAVLYDPGTGAKRVDDIPDDLGESLVLANAVLNSVSARSDLFAVWFIIHGYQEGDVRDLTTAERRNDPLVPSFARRYLMVVDRSNVVRRGEKPRIVFLQELPM